MKKQNSKTDNIFDYDYLSTAASAHDCTGLIPVAPPNADAWDSYADIYPFLPVMPLASNPGDQLEEQFQGISPEKYY